MPLVTITVSDNAAAMAARLRGATPAVLAAAGRAMDTENQMTVTHIRETKLTAAGPTYLNVRTGRLRRSARASAAEVQGLVIKSTLGSNVSYARVHEGGFVGVENVRGFIRRQKSRNQRGKVGGKRRATASGVAYVRPFRRRANIRARRPFGTGLDERLPRYAPAMATAIGEAVRAFLATP